MGNGDGGWLKALDDRVSVKLLLRVWGPRVEFAVRLILVATFLDDSFRVLTRFNDHTKQIGEQGCMRPLAGDSPELVGLVATVALSIGLLCQLVGSLCLIACRQVDKATKALIGWAIAQPILYAQLANVEFVAESLSIVGGLLILRAALDEGAKRDGYRRLAMSGGELVPPDDKRDKVIARTQLLGRNLLPAIYLYHALILLGNLGGGADHRAKLSLLVAGLKFIVDIATLLLLALGCGLVAAGLKSRTAALTLAVLNFVFVVYTYPFWRLVWRENGEWKYDESSTGMMAPKSTPHIALPADMQPSDFEPWQVVDLHRYYFFQGLSTSGALLLLAQFGPGEIAVEEDEVLLSDVQAARD